MLTLTAVLALAVIDEPVTCSRLDYRDVSVIFGTVEQVTRRREEAWSGWMPPSSVHFQITATIRSTRTLRGARTTRTGRLTEGCSAGWADLAGRRFCSRLLSRGTTGVFYVNRRTGEAGRNPDRDIVADYDQRMRRPLPRCEA